MRTMNTLLAMTAAAILAAPAAQAGEHENPYAKANNTWISIDGTVDAVTADAFELDYGPGLVTVEMDDGDRDADGYKLMKGDKVRVSGMIDDDLFETTSIEAASVYVENLGTYFFASSIDEEDAVFAYAAPIDVSHTILRGKVTSVDEENGTFTVDTGNRKLTVNVQEMPYNPLDDTGYQKVEKGERVSVAGDLELDFFDLDRELVAESVLTLSTSDNQDDNETTS